MNKNTTNLICCIGLNMKKVVSVVVVVSGAGVVVGLTTDVAKGGCCWPAAGSLASGTGSFLGGGIGGGTGPLLVCGVGGRGRFFGGPSRG